MISRLLALALLLGLFSTTTHAGYFKEIRDWYTSCTDGLDCTFQTMVKSEAVYSFGFQRSPMANAELVLFVSASGSPQGEATLRLIIDGDAASAISLNSANPEPDSGVVNFRASDEGLTSFLAAMMAGQRMTALIEFEGKQTRFEVSLSGVTGSALYVDDIQQRVGNRDALKAKGEGAPKDAETTVVELKSVSELPSEVAHFWLEHSGYCSEGLEDDDDLIESLGGLAIAVEGGGQLFMLPCGLPGAYNFPRMALAHDMETKQVRRLSFPVMNSFGPSVIDSPYNTNWDARNNTLSAFFKGRGLGDCGSRKVWKWGGGPSSEFTLVEQYEKDNCDGEYEDWPQVWPPQ